MPKSPPSRRSRARHLSRGIPKPQTVYTLSDEERKLFRDSVSDAVPLLDDRADLQWPRPAPWPQQREQDERAALAESLDAPLSLDLVLEGGEELNYLRESMPRSALRDLRRGRWVIQEEIDLHGANRQQAHILLADFLLYCRKRQIRCVRVIHGKGLGSPGKEPVLKKLVAYWLMNHDDVLAYCQARVHDGGAGALLVLLKAPDKRAGRGR